MPRKKKPDIVSLFTIREVSRLTKLSKATIYRLIARNQFPKPIKIGTSARWKLEQISNYVDDLGSDHMVAV